MRGAAIAVVASVLVPRLIFFFFHADLATICVNSGRVTLNQADSAKIGSYQLAAETDRNRLKSALNHAETAEISFE